MISLKTQPIYHFIRQDSVERSKALELSCFILANSADPDEMLPFAAFCLCLHCSPKYLFTRYQGYKTFFMLNSTEHKISTAHKNENTDK